MRVDVLSTLLKDGLFESYVCACYITFALFIKIIVCSKQRASKVIRPDLSLSPRPSQILVDYCKVLSDPNKIIFQLIFSIGLFGLFA